MSDIRWNSGVDNFDDLIDKGTSFGRGRGFIGYEPKSTIGSLQSSTFKPSNNNPSGGNYSVAQSNDDGWNSDGDTSISISQPESRSFTPGPRFGSAPERDGSDRKNDARGDGFYSKSFNKRDEDDDKPKFSNETSGDGDKPRERYIPPEPSEDETVIFQGGITSGINFDKYDHISVNCTGENIPSPFSSFESSGLRTILVDNIKKSRYIKPTPVQKYAMSIIMAGRDLMACAQTGSGKTAAFLLPVLHNLIENSAETKISGQQSQPQVVIVSPTRELTIQTFNEARKFAFNSIVKVCLAYGGTATFHQIKQIMKGCHILVATPGRLMDLVEKGRIAFSAIQYFILDEADRMLDLGFLGEIEKMLNHETMVTTGKRQTLMFSATFPQEIQRLASKFLNDYIFLAVGIVGGACADVEQRFHMVQKFDKRPKLTELIQEGDGEKTLVFVEQKRTADFIAAYLSQQDFPTTSIHGDRLQREREEALEDFKSGRMSVLVATAVAARGLDIKNVSHVINYDLPGTIDEYVHRIGRTGRVGNRGKATSFYDADVDKPLVPDLVKILTQASQEIPDWLQQEASESSYGSSFSAPAKYGGTDVRKLSQPSSRNEPEEEW